MNIENTYTFIYLHSKGFVGTSCFETNWVNNYDGWMHHERGDAGIVGFYSVHNSHREDRMFKFRYCKVWKKCPNRSNNSNNKRTKMILYVMSMHFLII